MTPRRRREVWRLAGDLAGHVVAFLVLALLVAIILLAWVAGEAPTHLGRCRSVGCVHSHRPAPCGCPGDRRGLVAVG